MGGGGGGGEGRGDNQAEIVFCCSVRQSLFLIIPR